MSFIPLHLKSHYSLGQGTASIEELVNWAVRSGTPALGLTDLENLYGQIRFHHACAAAGVVPLSKRENHGRDPQRCAR